jgi:hypothetical protein
MLFRASCEREFDGKFGGDEGNPGRQERMLLRRLAKIDDMEVRIEAKCEAKVCSGEVADGIGIASHAGQA